MMDFIANWYAETSYFIVILLLALLVTLISTLMLKFTSDQSKIKRLKEDIKKLRKKQKKHKDDQEKFLEVQKEMMSKNTEVMKQSFRPMIYTFVPIILILAWMAGNLAFEPLQPSEPFEVEAYFSESYTGDLQVVELEADGITINSREILEEEDESFISWMLQGEEGTYELVFEGEGFSESKEIIITNGKEYRNPTSEYDSGLERVVIGNDHVRPLGDFSLFGWNPGWLGTYIILSIFFSIVLRKALNVS